LVAHFNCGAYKDSVAGMDREHEIAFYIEELRKAKEIMLLNFSDAEIMTLFVDFEKVCKVEL